MLAVVHSYLNLIKRMGTKLGRLSDNKISFGKGDFLWKKTVIRMARIPIGGSIPGGGWGGTQPVTQRKSTDDSTVFQWHDCANLAGPNIQPPSRL